MAEIRKDSAIETMYQQTKFQTPKFLSPCRVTTYDDEIIYFRQNSDLPVNDGLFLRLYR
jgi:hypothetical protein